MSVRAFHGMKGVLTLLLLVAGAFPAAAQDRLMRGDVSGSIGWLNANHDELTAYQGWEQRSLLGEVGAGWYWTDHWKTDISFAATTESTLYTSVAIVQNGSPSYAPARIRLARRRLSATQQYQFGDNQWVHGYLGVGLDTVWERSTRRDDAVYAYDQVARQSRLIRPAVDHPRRTDGDIKPAASAGFKAYLTRRGFFRGDLRVTFADGPDEVMVRVGFGVDF